MRALVRCGHLVAIAALLAGGCEQDPPPPRAKPKVQEKAVDLPAPPIIRGNPLGDAFEYTYRHSKYKGYVSVSLLRDKLQVNFSSVMPKTMATVAGKKIDLYSARYKPLSRLASVDGRKYVGMIPFSAIDRHATNFAVEIPVVVDMPGYEPLAFKIEKLYFSRVGDVFAAVTKGPVALPGDNPKGTAALVLKMQHNYLATGRAPKGATLADVRYVALPTKFDVRKTRQCKGYRTMHGGRSFEVEIVDVTYTIYDRFSGKSIAEKVFRARDACPRTTYAKRSTKRIGTYPDLRTVKKWVKRAAR